MYVYVEGSQNTFMLREKLTVVGMLVNVFLGIQYASYNYFFKVWVSSKIVEKKINCYFLAGDFTTLCALDITSKMDYLYLGSPNELTRPLAVILRIFGVYKTLLFNKHLQLLLYVQCSAKTKWGKQFKTSKILKYYFTFCSHSLFMFFSLNCIVSGS